MNFLNFLTFDVDVFYSVCNSDSQLRNWRATMVRKWVELKTHFFGFGVLSFSFRFFEWIRKVFYGKKLLLKWKLMKLFKKCFQKIIIGPKFVSWVTLSFWSRKAVNSRCRDKKILNSHRLCKRFKLLTTSTFRQFQWRVQKSDKIRGINKKAKNKWKLAKMYSRK